jgi:hypothetical protein
LLLVYVDDATGRLMEMRFVKSESASTTAYPAFRAATAVANILAENGLAACRENRLLVLAASARMGRFVALPGVSWRIERP